VHRTVKIILKRDRGMRELWLKTKAPEGKKKSPNTSKKKKKKRQIFTSTESQKRAKRGKKEPLQSLREPGERLEKMYKKKKKRLKDRGGDQEKKGRETGNKPEAATVIND